VPKSKADKMIFKGKKVLLINPWIYDFAAYDMWAKPLGLFYIGSMLREYGCGIQFLDCLEGSDSARKPGGHGRFRRQIIKKPDMLAFVPRNYSRYGISLEEFDKRLAGFERPDAVLVTSLMTYWYPGVTEAIRRIKNIYADVPVLLGGIYATLLPEHASKFSGSDIIIQGEGEARVIETLCSMWHLPRPDPHDTTDLDRLPYPAFDLTGAPYVCIQTSRGCPYQCTYCASSIINKRFKRRDPLRVADEIEFWSSRGIRDFAFYDDALLFEPEHMAIPLMKEIMKRDIQAGFHCPNGLHANPIGEEVAALMKMTGFKTIRLGLETSDPVLQSATGSKVTNPDFVRAVNNLHKAGYADNEIGVYILFGLPNQDIRQVISTVDFVRASGARPMIAEYSPIPGTALWTEAVKKSPFPIETEPLFHNNSILPCRWENLTYEMYKKLKTEIK
jgi:radical SAM superfamily enzyme YgiQ (UPF0313 family)